MAIIALIFAAGCVQEMQPRTSDRNLAYMDCKDACEYDAKIVREQNLSDGPCLLNPAKSATDWVCDIAHNPRLPIDDLPENQCSAYREGKAKHFVELDKNCELIRAV
ncbi:MAG: hypothetical protein KKE71_04825 [Nanoarchaeota archaeon]|nr:hypothetical protein [Nanoarchaeota archaeon]MBU4451573.1 hypothetical protein [Nanoarchaeota archaeon]